MGDKATGTFFERLCEIRENRRYLNNEAIRGRRPSTEEMGVALDNAIQLAGQLHQALAEERVVHQVTIQEVRNICVAKCLRSSHIAAQELRFTNGT